MRNFDFSASVESTSSCEKPAFRRLFEVMNIVKSFRARYFFSQRRYETKPLNLRYPFLTKSKHLKRCDHTYLSYDFSTSRAPPQKRLFNDLEKTFNETYHICNLSFVLHSYRSVVFDKINLIIFNLPWYSKTVQYDLHKDITTSAVI